MKNILAINSIVAFTASFIKSAQLPADIANAKGVVKEIRGTGTKFVRVVVQWPDSAEPTTHLLNVLCEPRSTQHINNDV